MTSKMKDYKYCNQLFDMALDNGVVTEQDREQFMDSELFNLIKKETYLTAICAWISGKYAETVLNALYEKGFRCVDPSYKRKTTTKPTTDRIKEVFEEWLWNESGYTKEEIEFGKMFNGYEGRARAFYAGYMAALNDRGEG